MLILLLGDTMLRANSVSTVSIRDAKVYSHNVERGSDGVGLDGAAVDSRHVEHTDFSGLSCIASISALHSDILIVHIPRGRSGCS